METVALPHANMNQVTNATVVITQRQIPVGKNAETADIWDVLLATITTLLMAMVVVQFALSRRDILVPEEMISKGIHVQKYAVMDTISTDTSVMMVTPVLEMVAHQPVATKLDTNVMVVIPHRKILAGRRVVMENMQEN